MSGLNKFEVNTNLSVQDLIAIASLKEKLAQKEQNPEYSIMLEMQAKEIYLLIDIMLKSAVKNTVGHNFQTILELAPTYSITPKALMEASSQLTIEFQKIIGKTPKELYIEDVNNENIIESTIEKIIESTSTNSNLLKPVFDAMPPDLRNFAYKILEKGDYESEDKKEEEWIRLVKNSVIANIKQSGGRLEAVRFLRDNVFRSANWSDTDAHRFINSIKDIEEIEEPPAKARKNKVKYISNTTLIN